MAKKEKNRKGVVDPINSNLAPAEHQSYDVAKKEPQAGLPARPTEAYLAMIQGAVASPDIKMDVIEKLWEMQKESQDRDAKLAYAEAKARAQKRMPPSIASNKKNEHTSSKYSNLSAVNTEVVPVYAAEGFSLDFKTAESQVKGELTLIGTLIHEGGHSEEFPLSLPIDDKGSGGNTNKTQIQGRASTFQYCQRYLVCMIWNVATGHDNDGNASKPATKQQEPVAQPYPKKNFKKNIAKAAELVGSGERTMDDILQMFGDNAAAHNYYLTEKQKAKINALKSGDNVNE